MSGTSELPGCGLMLHLQRLLHEPRFDLVWLDREHQLVALSFVVAVPVVDAHAEGSAH